MSPGNIKTTLPPKAAAQRANVEGHNQTIAECLISLPTN